MGERLDVGETAETLAEALAVAIISADPLVRAGLVHLLETQGALTVVSDLSPEDLKEPLADADILIWDVDPDLDLALLADTSLPVLALVADDADAQAVLGAGAQGALERSAQPVQLSSALQAAAAGLVVLSPAFADPLAAETELLLEDLTPRELDVLALLTEGLSNKAIARALEISEHTAKFHVNALLSKFGARSRTEVAVRAVQMGLIRL